MTETEQRVDEKRVTRTVIRRRKKPKVEEEAAPPTEETKADAAAVAPESQVVEPSAEAPEAAVAEKTEKEVAETAAAEAKKEAAATQEAAAEPKVEKRPAKKAPTKRRSRADLLMAEYDRVGGLKKAGELATLESDTEQEAAEPLERVFQPERRQRRGAKRVIGKKDFKKTEITTPSARKRKLKIHQEVTVIDLAQTMGIKAKDVLQKLVELGSMISLNDRIDFETAEYIAHEFGFELENISFQEDELIPALKLVEEDTASLQQRPPVVTVMGHVDHGKTSLLDFIRKTKVAAGEAGGITQHIGAYRINTAKGDIAFIDTPGHEAFTAMRARGAQVTDLVILVVAADDGVKPQTIEAINHAKAAKVPIVVAINKIDKPGVNIDNVKRELSEQELVAEDWGGDIIMVPVSALTGEGIDSLLEMVALQAEILDLKANTDKPGSGFILEAKLEKGRGPVATVMITDGTLKRGDAIVAGPHGGRIRAMHDSAGQQVKIAGPATPVEITGLSGVPAAGDEIHALTSDADVKKVIGHRQVKEQLSRTSAERRPVSIEDLFELTQGEEQSELRVVLKGDVQGSLEAVQGSLEKLSTDKVKVVPLHASVGAISESDVMLAQASEALILGFNVRPDAKARKVAESVGVSIKVYRVIYELIDDVRKAMLGLLEPTYEEEYLGRAEVRDVFHISKVGTIAGSSVVDGKVTRGSMVRVVRDGVIIYEGKLSSLKRFKEDAKEVAQGYECGISVENFNDIKVGDHLEIYQMKEVATEL